LSVYFNRGLCLLKLNQLDASIADFSRVLALDAAAYPKAYTLRGKARVQQGRFAEAIADCEAMLRMHPNDAQALSILSYAKLRVNK
jgi:tetratricopeptide (TPR) repeat protein